MTSDRALCKRCGEPIGAYERIYAEYDGGAPISTGWLALPREPAPRALWHADCEPLSGRAAVPERAGVTSSRTQRGLVSRRT